MSSPTPKNRPSEELNSNVQPESVEIHFDDLDSEVDALEGKISEIARDQTSENPSNSSVKTSGQQSTQTTRKDSTLDERQLLREKLLKSAPPLPKMRQELTKVLVQKKTRLEGDIRNLSRRKEYDLLSQAIAQLRAVVRQLEIVAHASYELLKEVWLRVIQKFA